MHYILKFISERRQTYCTRNPASGVRSCNHQSTNESHEMTHDHESRETLVRDCDAGILLLGSVTSESTQGSPTTAS
eukprot:1098759-Prymnesium_polylepis.2